MEDSKSKFQHGILAIEPTSPIKIMVDDLRTKHDPASQKTMSAHITLTQPFLEKPNDETWKIINEILAEFDAMEINFGPVDIFENTTVVKFKIEPKEIILALRKRLHQTGFFNLTLPFTEGFIPHMTISEFASQNSKEAQELADELNKIVTPGSFMCDKITYFQPNQEFIFEPLKSLGFTHPSAARPQAQ